ncbi:unnamed protein product [Bursaphelenchus xylophilus]|nr:unnamed protein product [Bursaphelenchus xylophilus]CAG9121716.1 unnamed protein product [Bursaphelenchus xylophilus]
MAAGDREFEEIFDNFESEVKSRISDTRDWSAIFLKPFFRRHDLHMRDYADRIMDLTVRAFAGAPKEILERQMIAKFLSGVNHKEVGIALAAEKHKNLPFEEMVKIAINVYDYSQGNVCRPQQQQAFDNGNDFIDPPAAHLSGFWDIPTQNNRPTPQSTGGNISPNANQHQDFHRPGLQ